jgi:hypothetical protein
MARDQKYTPLVHREGSDYVVRVCGKWEIPIVGIVWQGGERASKRRRTYRG